MATLLRRSDKGKRRKSTVVPVQPQTPVIAVEELERMGEDWITDGRYRCLSAQTIVTRKFLLEKLVWWLRREGHTRCGTEEIKAFLLYVSTAHTSENGRWDNNRTAPLKARTVKDYYGILSVFFSWAVKAAYMEKSPMERLRPPVARPDQIQPFTEQQILDLLDATRKSRYPRRDEALILFLLDTAVRATELCDIRCRDVDTGNRRAIVTGKGNKKRAVYISGTTAKALRLYQRETPGGPDDPLFVSEHNEGLTRSGLQQCIERLGKAANIQAVRCSPHTFRHTAAIFFLRNGGNAFALREMLGHTTMTMTNRYVAVAEADVQNQHRQFSPVERVKTRALG